MKMLAKNDMIQYSVSKDQNDSRSISFFDYIITYFGFTKPNLIKWGLLGSAFSGGIESGA